MNKNQFEQRGFTLMEVLIAASIFTSVMIVAVSTFTKMNQMNDRATELRAVSENGRFAMESITRSISAANGFDGTVSHLQSVQICSDIVSGSPVNPLPQSPVSGLTNSLVTVQVNPAAITTPIVRRYWLGSVTTNDGKNIPELMVSDSSLNSGAAQPITDTSVSVTSFSLSGVSALTQSKITAKGLVSAQPYVTIDFTLKANQLRANMGVIQQEFRTSTVDRDYQFLSRTNTTDCASTTASY